MPDSLLRRVAREDPVAPGSFDGGGEGPGAGDQGAIGFEEAEAAAIEPASLAWWGSFGPLVVGGFQHGEGLADAGCGAEGT